MQMASDYQRRFGGIARLYGEDGLLALQSAHVCVVGVGGVGSWAVEALARSGVGQLTLIDLDNIAVSNVNRQLHALSDDFGKAKVRALHERIMQINPYCQVNEIEDFIEENNIHQYLGGGFNFVIDAIDALRVKIAMIRFFLETKQQFIISGSAGGQRFAEKIHIADLSAVTHDKMLANMRYTLRRHYGFSRNNKQKMNIPCVFSIENIIKPPINHGSCDVAFQGLSCSGYGASMLVTATFGLRCAQAAIEHICTN